MAQPAVRSNTVHQANLAALIMRHTELTQAINSLPNSVHVEATRKRLKAERLWLKDQIHALGGETESAHLGAHTTPKGHLAKAAYQHLAQGRTGTTLRLAAG